MICSFCKKTELTSNYEGGFTCQNCARVDSQISLLSDKYLPQESSWESEQKYLPIFNELQDRYNIPSKIVMLAQYYFLKIKNKIKTKSNNIIIFCCFYHSFKKHKKIISMKSMKKLFPIDCKLSIINKEYFKFKKSRFFGEVNCLTIADYINELTISINMNSITNNIAHAISFFVVKYVNDYETIAIISLILAKNFEDCKYINNDSKKLINRCCNIVGIGERSVYLKYNEILKLIT